MICKPNKWEIIAYEKWAKDAISSEDE